VEEFFLIYINYVGRNYEGNYFYEFIFSDTTDDVDGADWDTYPASGRPQPPDEYYIKKVGRLESELNLDVIQNSDTFAVWDAVDDVIAYETYPDKRLSFRFGETITETQNKLYEKDLILKYTK
jgi:hypothetical protein